MLANEQDRLSRLGAGDLQVRAAFEVSYQQLAGEDARLFRLLGLHPGPDFTAAAAAALARTGEEAAELVLGRLAEAHLVIEDSTGRFRMHDLLRLYARTTCRQADRAADRDAAETRLVSFYIDLANLLYACVNPESRATREQAGTPLPSMRQGLAVFQAERPSLMAALALAAQRDWDEQVLQLSLSMMNSLAILRYLDDLLAAAEAALAAARHAGDTLAEGAALNSLGSAYQELGRFEDAHSSHREAMAVFRERGNRFGEGVALNGLGESDRKLGWGENAIVWYLEALAIFRQTGHRVHEGRTLINLGEAWREAPESRSFENAITSYDRALAVSREIGDRRGEGIALNSLGSTYLELWRLEEAITSFHQVLEINRETGDRYGEAITLHNLGIAYEEMRQPDRATACLREAAAAMRDVGDHAKAARFDQLTVNSQSRWRLRRRRTSRPPEI
jgi:tetratricopeptide (TPR) repeat protein